MSDEQDGFMLNAFGVDLGQVAQAVMDDPVPMVEQVASNVVQEVQGGQPEPEARGVMEPAMSESSAPIAAPATAPEAPSVDDEEELVSRLQKGAKGLIDDAQDLGTQVISATGEQFEAARELGAEAVEGAQSGFQGVVGEGGLVDQLQQGAAGLVDDAKDFGAEILGDAQTAFEGVLGDPGALLNDTGAAGGGSTLSDSIDSLLGIGVGGQFSFTLIALPPDPGFPIGTVAFGQYAGKFAVKFKPTLLSSLKAPKPEEAEAGIRAICKELYENASFKWFGGVTVKGDKKSAGVAASFLKVSTKVGDVTLEIKTFEIGLDIKKIVKASFGSTSANFPVFEREVNGVNYEIDLTLGGALEVSPNPAAGAGAFTSGGILLAIDAALVAGPPLAAAAVIGTGIFMAGEKGARDAAILEGAVDARQAAFDYAITMTGSEGSGPGPRAKAAVAVAKAELANVASSQKVSLTELMTALRNDKNQAADFRRIHAQARQQIFGAYFGEVRAHLKKWRKQHSVLAAFTTEADDLIAVDKLVSIEFEKP